MTDLICAKKYIREGVNKSKLPFKKAWIGALNNTLAPWLTKFVKLDKINAIISSGSGKYEGDFNKHVVESLNLKVFEEGVENLPLVDGKLNGRNYVALSNHPLGALDGILLMDVMGKYASPTIFVGKQLGHFLKDYFGSYFTPVRGFKGQSKQVYEKINRISETDKLILAFPAGICSRKDKNGNVKDNYWQSGSSIVIRKERDIIPLYFDAKNPDWFYKRMKILDRFSKFKIVEELEFMYQPKVLFENPQTTFTITYGKPIHYEIFKGKNKRERYNLMQILREHSYRLKDDKGAEFEDTMKMYS